jgi:hypothetical protein
MSLTIRGNYMDLDKNDLDNLTHMLGAQSHIPKRDWGYRNFYAASLGDVPNMEKLIAAGLVIKGRKYCDSHYYHATEKGCKQAGLNQKQIIRALRTS